MIARSARNARSMSERASHLLTFVERWDARSIAGPCGWSRNGKFEFPQKATKTDEIELN